MIDTTVPATEPSHLVLQEDDLAYEEEILRNPHSIRPWIRYIDHKQDAPKNILNLVTPLQCVKWSPLRYLTAGVRTSA